MWRRIKNLWYISGVDLRPTKSSKEAGKMASNFMEAISGRKMAQIIETKDKEDLFPNEQEE